MKDVVVLLPDVSMRTGEGEDKPPLLLLLFCGRIRHSNRFGAGFASTYGQRLDYSIFIRDRVERCGYSRHSR